MQHRPPPEPWHLDRRVPIALIVTLSMQTMGMVWWASGLAHRVDQAEQQISVLAREGRAYGVEASRIREVLARLDERMAHQNELLRRMEAAITRRDQ